MFGCFLIIWVFGLVVSWAYTYELTLDQIDEVYSLESVLYERIMISDRDPTYYLERIQAVPDLIRPQSEWYAELFTRVWNDLDYMFDVQDAYSLQTIVDPRDHYREREPITDDAVFWMEYDQEEYPDWPVAVYTIWSDGMLRLNAWASDKTDHFLRSLLKESVYDFHSYRIHWVVFYTNPESDTHAYVYSLDELWESRLFAINTHWYLTYEYIDTIELFVTLLHEYAHIMSLEYDQVDWTVHEEDCMTIFLAEGCARDDAMLYTFVQEFRTQEHFVASEQWETQDDELYVEWEFVSKYAATNAAEDFAETFAQYMITDEILYWDSVVVEKLQFFDRFPALQKKRERSRALALRILQETIWY